MFTLNGLGDVALMGRILEGAIGATVVGAVRYYLTLHRVRAAFIQKYYPIRSVRQTTPAAPKTEAIEIVQYRTEKFCTQFFCCCGGRL
jgi:hypothetical protein